jgi:hypothetical protein
MGDEPCWELPTALADSGLNGVGRFKAKRPVITAEHANRVLMEYPDADLSAFTIEECA